MAVREPKKQAGVGSHTQGVIGQVVAKLIYAVIGEVQFAVRIPVVAHSISNACRQHHHLCN